MKDPVIVSDLLMLLGLHPLAAVNHKTQDTPLFGMSAISITVVLPSWPSLI
jgi:hypothetical protein